jgi:hypothetical protein
MQLVERRMREHRDSPIEDGASVGEKVERSRLVWQSPGEQAKMPR